MWRRLLFVLLIELAPLAAWAADGKERPVMFGPVDTVEQRAFVEAWLPHLSGEPAETWQSRLDHGQVRWAEIDIDRNGTPERFVMAAAPQDCNQYGCQTYVARFSVGRWWPIFAHHMPEDEVTVPEARQGMYYLLRSGTTKTFFTLEDGEDVTFRPLADAAERGFARDWLIRNSGGDEPPAFWRKAVDEGRIRIATADLNDDGRPERLLMVDDFGWCGTAGCTTFILRREHGRWVCSTEINMHDSVRILTEKRNGWHRLQTGTNLLTFDKNGDLLESIELATDDVAR